MSKKRQLGELVALDHMGYHLARSGGGVVWRSGMRWFPRPWWTRALILLAAVVVGYFVFSAVGGTLLSQRLNRDEQQLQREIEELRAQEAELVAIREYLQTEEYIEGVARRVLGLVQPGETLIIVSSSVTPVPTSEGAQSEDERRTWWEELYSP